MIFRVILLAFAVFAANAQSGIERDGLNDPDRASIAGLSYAVYPPRTEGVKPPAIVQQVDPAYTEEARQAKVNGTVLIRIVIDLKGRVARARVVRSLGFGLDDAAIQAVKKWRFSPALKDDIPVGAMMDVELNFHVL